MWGLAQALHCRDLTLKLSHRLLWAPGKAGPLLGGGGGTSSHPVRELSKLAWLCSLAFLEGLEAARLLTMSWSCS